MTMALLAAVNFALWKACGGLGAFILGWLVMGEIHRRGGGGWP